MYSPEYDAMPRSALPYSSESRSRMEMGVPGTRSRFGGSCFSSAFAASSSASAAASAAATAFFAASSPASSPSFTFERVSAAAAARALAFFTVVWIDARSSART